MKKNSSKDLTQGKILPLLVKLAIPIMLSNLMMVFYNITDTFWVGKIKDGGAIGVAVTANIFPVIWVVSAFSSGFLVAGTAIISHTFGSEKDDKHLYLRKVIGQISLILSFFGLLFAILGIFFNQELSAILNTPQEIRKITGDFIGVILFSLAFTFVFNIYQSIAHAEGDSVTPMIINIISVVFNMIVDPLMIFGFSFIPAYGVMGAAYTTLVARILAAVLGFYYLYKNYKNILPKLRDYLPDYPLLSKILNVALPSSLSQSLTSFGFFIIQIFINHYGTFVSALNSISNQAIGVFLIPATGLNSAMVAIIGQNLGANKIDRAEEVVWVAVKLVGIVMGIGAVLLFFYGSNISAILVSDAKIIKESAYMFKICSISAFICSFMFIFLAVMDGSGHSGLSLKVGLIRLWCVRIPFSLLFSGFLLEYLNLTNTNFLYLPLKFFATVGGDKPYSGLWWAMVLSNSAGLFWSYKIFKSKKWQISKFNH